MLLHWFLPLCITTGNIRPRYAWLLLVIIFTRLIDNNVSSFIKRASSRFKSIIDVFHIEIVFGTAFIIPLCFRMSCTVYWANRLSFCLAVLFVSTFINSFCSRRQKGQAVNKSNKAVSSNNKKETAVVKVHADQSGGSNFYICFRALFQLNSLA